ncbi:hypothetical protein FOZ63_032808 [Perkinsus olseni]|uniref:Uncharacterized protein n=1 Tax=Perkinsus olseni TaxID=32597 RepID=A0A7J6UC32_PEROL|nr:hypothetical protein FOZ63_032808 [Perkinsus olseni]
MLFVLLVAVVAAKSPLDAGAGWAEDVIGWVGDFNHSKALAWSTHKPILAMVHQRWSSASLQLARKIRKSVDLQTAAGHFIMLDAGNLRELPDHLTPVVNVSKYYPRVYFFYPDGKLMEDVTSGREDKFPYFYADEEELIASMKRALRQTRESMCHD